MAIAWNKEDPLAKCRGESRKANDALRDYWLMGKGRSLSKLHRLYTEGSPGGSVPTRQERTLKGWSSKFAWQARIDRAKALQDAETDRLWQERQMQIREDGWRVGQNLREKVEQVLGQSYGLKGVRQKKLSGKILQSG